MINNNFYRTVMIKKLSKTDHFYIGIHPSQPKGNEGEVAPACHH
jgi:hypothetical protein